MTVIIMAIIYTCLLIRKVTYRYFLIFAVLQNMIHMDSCTLFFRMKSFLPDYTVSKVLLDSAHDAMLEFCWHDHSRFREIINIGKEEILNAKATTDRYRKFRRYDQ